MLSSACTACFIGHRVAVIHHRQGTQHAVFLVAKLHLSPSGMPTAGRKLQGSTSGGSDGSRNLEPHDLPVTPEDRKMSPSDKWRQAAGDIGAARYAGDRLFQCSAAVSHSPSKSLNDRKGESKDRMGKDLGISR